MNNNVNFTVVGLFVVVLAAAFIIIFFWLSGTRHDKTYDTYLSYVHDDVTGLSVQSPVRFNGVQVGYVSGIKLDPSNPQLVIITLKIEQGTPVTTSTVVTLLPMGITGVIYAGLKAKTRDAPLLTAAPGERYPVIPFQPSFLMQLGTVLPELTDDLKEISENISKVFDEKNRQAISSSLQYISVITKNLSDNSEKLSSITNSLNETLQNTSEASKQFPQIVDEVHETMKNIQQTTLQINAASKNAKVLMAQGGVMVNNLNTQLLPSAQQILMKLNTVMLNLTDITQQARRNPSMFIRGKQAALLGPGERQ